MSDRENSTVMHRKARQGRAGPDARAPSPARALRRAVEKSGDRVFGLALTVCAIERRRLDHAALADAVGGHDLIALLDRPDGRRGAALLDPALVQALIEVQTTGCVRPGPPPARLFTGTDAAMAAPLLDAAMTLFAQYMTDDGRGDDVPPPGTEPGEAFRFWDQAADARALALAVAEDELDLFCLTIDIAGGTTAGGLSLILPVGADAAGNAAGGGGKADGFDLGAVALGVPVTLDAVLARLRLPLSEVCALRPGMVLPLSAAAIAGTELVASGGHVAARGRLGKMHGYRALRLAGPAAPPGHDGEGAPPEGAPAAAVPASLAPPAPSGPRPPAGEGQDTAASGGGARPAVTAPRPVPAGQSQMEET